jgi:hypothetical protein
MGAAGAPRAAHDDLQDGGTPPQRFVRQSPDHGVTRRPFAAAAAAPLVRLHDPAGELRTVRSQSLAGHFEAELIESAERGQVRAGEAALGGSVGHVEVFRMWCVGTLILGRPRPLSAHRRADQRRVRPHTSATPSIAKSRSSQKLVLHPKLTNLVFKILQTSALRHSTAAPRRRAPCGTGSPSCPASPHCCESHEQHQRPAMTTRSPSSQPLL